MDWTKVTPKTMPPNGEPVIVTLEETNSKKRFTEFDVAWSKRQGEWIWINFGTTPMKTAPVSSARMRVTHWMPYPKPAED